MSAAKSQIYTLLGVTLTVKIAGVRLRASDLPIVNVFPYQCAVYFQQCNNSIASPFNHVKKFFTTYSNTTRIFGFYHYLFFLWFYNKVEFNYNYIF